MQAAIRAGADELLAEVELHAIRQQRGVTQQALAEALSVSRPRVSEIQRSGEDLRLSTVQRYVEAMGGHPTITARCSDPESYVSRRRLLPTSTRCPGTSTVTPTWVRRAGIQQVTPTIASRFERSLTTSANIAPLSFAPGDTDPSFGA